MAGVVLALAGLELRIWIGLGFHGFFSQRYRDASTSANGLNTRLILLCSIGRKPSHQFPASGTAILTRLVLQAEYRLNDTEHIIERQNHAKPSTVLIPRTFHSENLS
jgi:hypothetical protein